MEMLIALTYWMLLNAEYLCALRLLIISSLSIQMAYVGTKSKNL